MNGYGKRPIGTVIIGTVKKHRYKVFDGEGNPHTITITGPVITGPVTKHRYKVLDGEGNPHTITITVWECQVYRGCYEGRWRNVFNEEPMYTREQAARGTLRLVQYIKGWPRLEE